MIGIFKVSYWIVAVLSFLMALASIIALGVQRSEVINACVVEYPEESYDSCSGGYRTFMIIYSIVLMVICFIQVRKPQNYFIWYIDFFVPLVLFRHSH